MAGQWYNTKTEIKKEKDNKRYGIEHSRRRKLVVHILFIYLILDIIADFI